MLMYKIFPFFIFMSFCFMFLLILKNMNLSFNMTYLYNSSDLLKKFDFSLNLDYEMCCFLFMVLLVTCMVLLYSEFYMEHYNNKKFLFLMILFFFSMVLLSSSGSYMILMLGWDGLGVTSICLIMFYPNKMTLYNSSLTMLFNRLGDVILILIMSMYVTNPVYFFFMESNDSLILFLLFLICSFTKSAQFPLSSWLPAAMSAPTPISAMVHSSTLVTAGIFLMNKLSFYLDLYSISFYLCLVSSLTFLSGGLMANLEKDFKKIVAFSTMSQISMIMYFCSLNFIFLSLAHMIFHAFFKTLLFCCSGVYFVLKFSDQIKTKFNSKTTMKYLSILFFFSIFMMSGLCYSTSFYSKDLLLEIILMKSMNSNFYLLLLGSILTLMYCSKLLDSVKSFFFHSASFLNKNYDFKFFLIFCLVSFFFGKIFSSLLMIESWPLVQKFWVLMIFFFLITGIFYKFNFGSTLFFYSTIDILFMKSISYSYFSNFMKNYILVNITNSDHFFFKPTLILSKKFNEINSFFNLKKSFFFLIFLFMTMNLMQTF